MKERTTPGITRIRRVSKGAERQLENEKKKCTKLTKNVSLELADERCRMRDRSWYWYSIREY